MWQDRCDECMPSFVIRGYLFFFHVQDVRATLWPKHYFFYRTDEIVLGDFFTIFACGEDGCFVHQIGQVGTRESGGSLSYDHELHICAQGLFARVGGKNFFSVFPIRKIDGDTTVETAWSKERGVEHIGSVRRRHDDDFLSRLEPVHLDEYLIECLFALVVAAAHPGATHPPDCVYFIDEDDGWRRFFRRQKEVAHTRSANADEHLDEFRS